MKKFYVINFSSLIIIGDHQDENYGFNIDSDRIDFNGESNDKDGQ